MIKFFRHIRQNLLSDGKTGKYLKYAIGEIILVVIGILIALGINNWNETKKETIATHNILLEIKEDLLQDKAQLEYSLDKHSKNLEAELRVLKALESRDSLTKKLSSDLGHIHLARTYYSVSKGYELLKEMNLSSSLDKNLRISLTKYYERDIPEVYRELDDDKTEYLGFWIPYLREHFKEWEFEKYAIPYDYNQILEDRNLITALRIDCVNLRGTIKALDLALKSATDLIDKLPKEKQS